jgi:hypothetical protein
MLLLQICALHDAMYHLMYMVHLYLYVSHLLRPRPISGAGSMYLSHQLLLDDFDTIPNLISSSHLSDCYTSRISTNDPVTNARNLQTLSKHLGAQHAVLRQGCASPRTSDERQSGSVRNPKYQSIWSR